MNPLMDIALLNVALMFFVRSLGVSSQSHQPQKREKNSPQRKTTLKWSRDGELSSIDMTSILDKLAKAELLECDLACGLNESTEIKY